MTAREIRSGDEMTGDLNAVIESLRSKMNDHQERLVKAETTLRFMEKDLSGFRRDLENICLQLVKTDEKLTVKLDAILKEQHESQGAKRLAAWAPSLVSMIVGIISGIISIYAYIKLGLPPP